MARENEVKMSSWEYIIFIDNDDWVESIFIEKLYDEIQRTQSDIGICKRYKFEFWLFHFYTYRKRFNNRNY